MSGKKESVEVCVVGKIAIAELAEWLAVDLESRSGLVWIKRPARNVFPGSPAFASVGRSGYYHGCLKGKTYLAHRVVFAITNGFMPDEVDHIDGNKRNNHPENLRSVTRSENQHNRVEGGVAFHRKRNRYQARIQVNLKKVSLGYYNTYDEANEAYLMAKRNLHPTAPERCYK